MVQEPVDGKGARGHAAPARWLRPLTAGITVALFAFHLWITHRITGPSVVFDEGGYLGNARWLAGGDRWDMPTSPAYAVGYPVLLTPVMAVFHSADAQWRAVLVVNAALLASVFPLLVHVFRQVLGAPRRLALLAAGLGALAPCVVAAGGSAIAENLVLPLVPALVAATWAITSSGRPHRRAASYAFGPLVSILVVTHPRFTLLVPVALVALVFGARRGIVARATAWANGLSLVALFSAGTVLDRVVRRARWADVEMLQGGPREWLRLLGDVDGVTELVLTGVGQLWYLAAGSLGMSVVGIWFLLRGTTGDPARPLRSGAAITTPEAAGPPMVERDRRFTIGFVLVAAAAVFATSVLFFAQNQFRADHWVYGRHNDSFTPLWLGAGLIALVGPGGARRRLAWLTGAAGVIVASGMVVWATRDPSEMENQFSTFAVPALSRVVAHDPASVFVRATAVATLAVAAIAVIVWSTQRWNDRPSVRRIGLLGIPLLLAPYFAWTGYGTIAGTELFRDYLTTDWSTPDELRRLGVTTLEIEGRTARSLPSLLYPFALPDVDTTMYDAQQGEPTGPFVLARVDDPMRRDAGDRLVLVDANVLYALWDSLDGIGVWVRPGADQDRLAAAGLLLPAGFPTVLPDPARSVELQVDDGLEADGTLRMTGGSEARLTVSGRHTGVGSPWPDAASARTGRVQVLARVVPDDPLLPSGIGSGGELDRWVRPGEEFTGGVTVRTVGPLFADLAPGRYTVHLGVGQADERGELWFADGGPGASFSLVVD